MDFSLERPWDIFFKKNITRILQEKKTLLDIGGGLRLTREKSNRTDSTRQWILDCMKKQGTHYIVLDYVDTYHPDIVGDVQNLSLPDNSEEAIACISVLEHVENPSKAVSELYRVLKPGGFCFLYMPFLYYYHAERGYYGDYWRFTEDAVRMLSAPFSSTELIAVRGPLETIVRLTPFGRGKFFQDVAYILDGMLKKRDSKQVSGYYVFLTK